MSSGNIYSDIHKIDLEINKVKKKIEGVQAKIAVMQEKIARIEQEQKGEGKERLMWLFPKLLDEWVDEWRKLWHELRKLWDEEDKLRDEEDKLREEEKLRDEKEKLWLSWLRDEDNRNLRAPKRVFCFSVSVSSKDSEKRSEFRETLPDTPYPGTFVAHDFYIAFVKAARRMSEIQAGKKVNTQWPSDSLWEGAIEKVTLLGNGVTRQHNSLFSQDSEICDHEEPQSALAAELLRHAILCLQADPTDNRICVSHQFTIMDAVKEEPGTSFLFPPEHSTDEMQEEEDVTLEFRVDILVWVSPKDDTMGCTAIAAAEYKPDATDEDARKAKADMYGVNIMSMHQKLCIAVDIEGGQDWTSWKVCASGIIPINLCETGLYSKSTLFEGTGAEGIVGLAAGVIKAVDCISDKTNDFGRLLGPVVGYSGERVTKAYDDGETYRHHNYDLIREFVDSSASLFESNDKTLRLVETTYFETDWTKPVPLSVFADLVEQLSRLHSEHGPHGDIRLANMLRKKVDGKETACLNDFDFVNKETKKAAYPYGLHNITDDGERHKEVRRAIERKSIQFLPIREEHDYHSMHAVMSLFNADTPSVTSKWDQCKTLTEEGQLDEAVKKLREVGDAGTLALSKPLADKIQQFLKNY